MLEALCLRLLPSAYVGNSLEKLRHTRTVAYSVELALLNKQQISGGGAYPDCYPTRLPLRTENSASKPLLSVLVDG